MSNFLNELKRRNVIKAAIAYAVVAWVLLQVLSLILPNVGAPEWVMKTITILAIIGFPVWVFIAWVYEVTPEGLKKTEKVSKDDSITAITNKRLNVLILVGLVIAIAVSFFNRPNQMASTAKDLVELDNSIAVLYFDDLSSGGDTEWFCDGVTEDILTNLSKFKNLKVTSKTSTKRYKKSDKSIPEIARELGVSYVVEGSVRKYEGKIIITAQLIDANDKHIWAQNYDDEFKEVFKIQQDVSRKIVDQLKIAISPDEQNELAKLPTNNLEAYNLVLRGRSFAEKVTKEDYAFSINLFKQAIALDPDYADAHAELAYAYLLSMYLNRDKSLEGHFIKEATKENEIALSLNPNSVRANSTQGLIMTESKDEQIRLQSEDYFQKALMLNPNDAVSHLEIAIFYDSIKKDKVKALFHARKAYELNPFAADTFLTLIDELSKNNLFEEATEFFENNKANFPVDVSKFAFPQLVVDKAKFILENNEDYNKSIEIYNNAISKNPSNPYLYYQKANFYDTYLNDDENYVKFSKKAMELDSTDIELVATYYNALLENKQFKEAKAFGNSSVYLETVPRSRKLLLQFMFHYHQNQNKEALEIQKDSVFDTNYFYKLLIYSQMGNKNKVYEIMKANKANSTQKAYTFANLKERDSMYYYLNKDDILAPNANSRREFDPYRKEPRFIEFQKKNHIPIVTQKN